MSVKRLIKDAFAIKRKIDDFSHLYKEKVVKIKDYFDKHNISELIVESETSNDVSLVAKKSERLTQLEYFPDKLKEKLDPEIYNEIVEKTYFVNDMPGLIQLMKKYSVKPSEFKQFIDVTETINKESVKRLFDTGDIKKSDIKGTFTAKVTKSIKIEPHNGDG